MNRKQTIVVTPIVYLLGVFSGLWLARFIEIDKCLDAGGIWNSGTVRCEASVKVPLPMDKCLELGGRWDYASDACDLR